MAATESTMLELGTVAPDFALPDAVSGKTVSRDDYAGKKPCSSSSSAPIARL
jgi:hypothetical protein